jgi:hypothetical protein
MQKVVHLFYIFTTIFYFNFFRSGKSFLYWLKFELIKNLLNHVNRIQIHSNCPALCFGTPLVSAPSSPAPLPLMLPDHARLHRGRVWLSIGPPPPTPSSTRHPQARPPPPPMALTTTPTSKGAERPPSPSFSSSRHFFPNWTPHEAPTAPPLPVVHAGAGSRHRPTDFGATVPADPLLP